ncbi:hypothetical protein KQX54_007096 [Cotesia glomerata]|uniref:Uncharacterized protein n=1 Tax=Cotesia glomerata TaxID=32391 RepID=A0AAV7IJI9_COTGL|nr:hypothetical protein KQX54_007096 [Cotesia glomerata]
MSVEVKRARKSESQRAMSAVVKIITILRFYGEREIGRRQELKSWSYEGDGGSAGTAATNRGSSQIYRLQCSKAPYFTQRFSLRLPLGA